MKKLTTLVISFALLLTMCLGMSVSVYAADIPADGVIVPSAATTTKSSSGTVSYGSNYASIPNGQWITFPVTVPESGIYSVTTKQISWNITAAYKLFVNDMPYGVVDIENTKDAQQTTEVSLGNIELLNGVNDIMLYAQAPKGVWLYNLTITKTGDITGTKQSVGISNTARATKIGNWSGTHVQTATAGYAYTFNVPAAGAYKVYYASANHAANPTTVNLLHAADTITEYSVASNIKLPSHGEWGSYDKAFLADVNLAAGENTLKVTLNSGVSMRPRALMIEKATIVNATYVSGLGGNQDMGKNGQARFNFTIPEAGRYRITADVATNNQAEVNVQLFQYIDGKFPTLGYQTVTSPAWTTWATNVTLLTCDFAAGDSHVYIKPLTDVMRVKNVKLTKVEPETTLYLGETVAVNKAMTTLRNGIITVQTALPEADDTAVAIAVLYANGEIIQVTQGTLADGVLTATLDATEVSPIAACNVKVFVWNSLTDLAPICKVAIR